MSRPELSWVVAEGEPQTLGAWLEHHAPESGPSALADGRVFVDGKRLGDASFELSAGARVELFTRSGNTRVPDEAWSDWSAAYTVPEGSPITSPKARLLQWRAVLTGGEASPVLTSVSAAYLQRNVRPRVTSITVHPPGVVFQKPFSTGEAEIAGYDGEPQDRRLANQGNPSNPTANPALGRRIYQKGLQTFAWKAEDENGDELVFDVLYRREGETEWRPLKSALADTLVVWDTSSAPNGTYVLKVVASDTRSNPSESTLRRRADQART